MEEQFMEAELASLPQLERGVRGPIVTHCPPPETPGLDICWKLENPNPGAQFDFFALITVQKVGDIMSLMSMLIPTENGELVRFVKTAEYLSIMKNTYIKTMKSSHTNFGVVQISHMKVRTYYEGFQLTVFATNFKVCRYDSNWNQLEPCQTVSAYDFPPLPHGDPTTRDVSLEYRLNQLDARNIAPQDAIYFPTYELDPSGEIIVDNGMEYGERELGRVSIGALTRATRAPGVYIEFAEQAGSPSLVLSLYWLQPADGAAQFLFGDYCTGYAYHKIREHVFVKKKKSWWGKTKKKITIVRKELKIDAVRCYGI